MYHSVSRRQLRGKYTLKELWVLPLPSSLLFFSWKAKFTQSWSILKSINCISLRWQNNLQIFYAGRILRVIHFIFHSQAQAYAGTYTCTFQNIFPVWNARQREEGEVQTGRQRDWTLTYVSLLWGMLATWVIYSHMEREMMKDETSYLWYFNVRIFNINFYFICIDFLFYFISVYIYFSIPNTL